MTPRIYSLRTEILTGAALLIVPLCLGWCADALAVWMMS